MNTYKGHNESGVYNINIRREGESPAEIEKKGAYIVAVRRQVRTVNKDIGLIYRNSERYIYGSAIAQPDETPVRRQAEKEGAARTSGRVMKNRRRSFDIKPAYVLFLTIASSCALLICLFYLGLQCKTSAKARSIAALQMQLDELTEENDTAYSAIIDSVDLEKIRDKAVNELGMVYASEGRIEKYDLPAGYVLQYRDIPCGGITSKTCGVAGQSR